MTILESYPAFASEGCPIEFYRKIGICFHEQKPYVLKIVFSHTWLRQA